MAVVFIEISVGLIRSEVGSSCVLLRVKNQWKEPSLSESASLYQKTLDQKSR